MNLTLTTTFTTNFSEQLFTSNHEAIEAVLNGCTNITNGSANTPTNQFAFNKNYVFLNIFEPLTAGANAGVTKTIMSDSNLILDAISITPHGSAPTGVLALAEVLTPVENLIAYYEYEHHETDTDDLLTPGLVLLNKKAIGPMTPITLRLSCSQSTGTSYLTACARFLVQHTSR